MTSDEPSKTLTRLESSALKNKQFGQHSPPNQKSAIMAVLLTALPRDFECLTAIYAYRHYLRGSSRLSELLSSDSSSLRNIYSCYETDCLPLIFNGTRTTTPRTVIHVSSDSLQHRYDRRLPSVSRPFSREAGTNSFNDFQNAIDKDGSSPLYVSLESPKVSLRRCSSIKSKTFFDVLRPIGHQTLASVKLI